MADQRQAHEKQAEREKQAVPKQARRRPKLTGRAAVLALVVCALVAALAYPMRQFIAQRSQIAQQRAAQQQAQQQVDELRRERARWEDPAYVEAQARQRLHYGFPGDVPFNSVLPTPTATASPSAQQQAAAQPWYQSLLGSLDSADSADRTTQPGR
ncbi:septum formation initiator family protein [Streptacidiphilus fuscans]|uniref:septum formation initiator family protein n=1 Tax=Streptacidiphilus fuscans TaxID=2789292 RepID=UPI002E2A3AC9|nr:septum formation initiator family protein [Streptacidiphilus fuscans]